MGTLWQDVSYGLRVLLRRPGFTVVAVVALALGIGANTAIFSVLNAVLLRPLPFAEPQRLVYGEGMSLQTGERGGSISPPDFRDIRAQNRSFEKLAAMQLASYAITGEGEPERATATRVTANFFETLGVAPLVGRAFLPEEEQQGHNTVAVLSYGLWQRRYGGDPSVVGRTITLSGQPYTVVGVAPQSFQYPRTAQLWTAMPLDSQDMSVRRFHFLTAIGRLRPGVTIQQAQNEMNSIARQLERQYPDSNTDYGLGLTLLPERVVGELRSSLLLLSVAVGLVLLVACANVANLSLARGATRAREIAVRAALGASRWRIVRQLLTESVVLALAGGALGLLIAVWGVDVLVSLSPDTLPRLKDSAVDMRALGFTLAVSLLTGVLFGLAPALTGSRADLNEALKEGGRGTGEGGGRRLRAALVVAEMALALVLSVGAGLLVKSFVRLTHVETGFDATHVLTMQLSLTRAKYPQPEQRAEFYRQLFERIRSLPGVEAVGTVTELPLSGQENDTYFTAEGRPPAAAGSGENNANSRNVSADYFRAMGIPLLKGRYFTEQDTRGAPHVVIISESFAHRVFNGEDPIGKHITIDFGEPWTGEIVGVVGSIRHSGLAQEPYREMYTSAADALPFGVNLVVRTAGGDPAQLTAAVKRQVQSLDKDLPLYNVKTMTERVSEAAAQPRFRTLLLGLFAALAVVLAAVGIYGVMAYSVTQRTHEIGIRMALGAQTGDIVRLVVRQGMLLGLVGLSLGLVAAFALTRLLATLLYGVKTHDPLVFAGTPLLLALVALLACYIPARRATKVDPMVALRYE